MNSFLAVVTAVSTAMSAFFLFQTFRMQIKATATFNGLDESSGKPVFWLAVKFTAASFPLMTKSIEVTGAKIPSTLSDAAGEFVFDPSGPTTFVFGKQPLRICVSPSQTPFSIAFPVVLLHPDSPLLEVEVQYDFFRRTRTQVVCALPPTESASKPLNAALQAARKAFG